MVIQTNSDGHCFEASKHPFGEPRTKIFGEYVSSLSDKAWLKSERDRLQMEKAIKKQYLLTQADFSFTHPGSYSRH